MRQGSKHMQKVVAYYPEITAVNDSWQIQFRIFSLRQKRSDAAVFSCGTKTVGGFGTLPAGFAGGLHADLDQNVLGGSVLPTVVGRHRQLVHVLFAVAQLLRVLDET